MAVFPSGAKNICTAGETTMQIKSAGFDVALLLSFPDIACHMCYYYRSAIKWIEHAYSTGGLRSKSGVLKSTPVFSRTAGTHFSDHFQNGDDHFFFSLVCSRIWVPKAREIVVKTIFLFFALHPNFGALSDWTQTALIC